MLGIFRWDLGSGGVQSIGNGCRLQMDGFSAHFEPYGSIFNDFNYFVDFGVVFDGLMSLAVGPRTI